ncbi:hypothetical protein RN001_001435 [Aquatica leii]|uniref:CCHC-type domain-containing protein n=1 Tax=Aquatica leii TaxID=1421715 RepID=A0AAN7SL83_9COLE|nr:hypothetical protein RN001_001435 [Aquatica leii]
MNIISYENAGAPAPLNPGEGKSPSKHLFTSQEKAVTPRFLVVRKVDGDFSKDSPFVIQRQLYGLIGETKNIRKVREGLLVETVSSAQANKLLKTERLGESKIEVTPHNTLNSSRGVINCKDLLVCTTDEICAELKSQGVKEVRRIKKKVNGELQDTPNHILTFNVPKIPSKIKAGYLSLPVRAYIPAPMRCFRCQKFGHTAQRCENMQVCVCGKELHEGRPCENPLECVNCKGQHLAISRQCPTYKQESAIQEIKVRENISYPEARRKIVLSSPQQGISYAKMVEKKQQIDTTQLVKELVPTLVTMLKEVFVSKDTQVQRFQTPTTRSRVNSVSSQGPAFSDVGSEKRKRIERAESSYTTEDELTGSSEASSKISKKKKGWPKGKPRKGST